MTTWIVDTSPLVFLAKLRHLDLLREGADTICVPQAVLSEVRPMPGEATQAIEQASLSWLSVRQVSNREAVEILRADLDVGEAEVITCCATIWTSTTR